MRIVDMFVHPVLGASEGSLHDLSGVDWADWLHSTIAVMDAHQVGTSGVCVMDEGILDRPGHLECLAEAASTGRFFFTLQPDFRRADALERVELAAAAGFRGLTFHSYLQEIAAQDYPAVVRLAQRASGLGLFSGFCTAHGSKRMFDFYSLPLVAEVAKVVSGPVFLYHNGGARVLEAMLLCEMWPNLYLETSFSLSYWKGSSVEADLAFAIKKIGPQRVLFGSDAPFVGLGAALRDHEVFFSSHRFEPSETELILGGAARSVLPFLT
jgi:predicted TIM-barrel fold metal-dependent hydrolase